MKKAIKGLLGLTCAAMLSVSFVACSEEEAPPATGGENPPVVQSKDPAVVGESHGYYFEELPGDMTFSMRLSGGTFLSVKADGTELTRNNEYKFNIGTEVLTLNDSWLKTLSEGDHTVTFATDLGSCNITVTIGEKGLAQGYNLQIEKTDNDLNDNFYVKAGRTETAVTFDFLTFGDFGKEGAGLEFINVLIDNPPFDDTGLNWRLSSEDVNVRVYSDGSVVYRTFTGTEEKNGVQNGMDNIWWRINRTKPNYKTDGVNDVTISRQGGVTRFSLELTYEFLKIDAADDIRFALMECSDTSQNDFNLYDRGLLSLDGVAFDDPVRLSHWPMLDADGNVVRPENIVVKGVPEGYDLSFAMGGDRFFAKTALEETGVTFDFWTQGNFGTGANGGMEFVNIYLDMPNAGKWNKTGKNWAFESEDINIRVYSDGTVYKKTGFDGTADNVWYPRSVLTESDRLGVTAETTKSGGATFVSVTIPYSELNNATKDTFGGFRFYLAEGADNSNSKDFDYFGGDLSYQDKSVGADWNISSWPLLDKRGDIVRSEDIVEVGIPADAELTFAKQRDGMYGKITLAEDGAGVTFDFYTNGTFEGNEFVNIYLDMPDNGKWNTNGRNWAFDVGDINIRVYADGTVYKKADFTGAADGAWYHRDVLTNDNILAQRAVIATDDGGTTKISVTLTFEQLNTSKADFAGFRFYLSECADNAVNYDYAGADLSYCGVAFETPDCLMTTWPLFDQTGRIVRPEQIDGVPEGYDLLFAGNKDKIYSKISYTEGTGVTFDFWTKGDFDSDGEINGGAALEFVQIYLDMPAFNTPYSGNWKFNAEDIIVRIYSDGSVYFKTNFNGNADNIWLKRDAFGDVFKTIAIDKTDGVTSFGLTLTLAELGIADGSLESFRFYLAECSDQSGNDFAFYGSNLYYRNIALGDAANCDNFATFTLATNGIELP